MKLVVFRADSLINKENIWKIGKYSVRN